MLAGYLVGMAVLLVLLVRQAGAARRRKEQERQLAGRTCSCCTSTVFDPVEVTMTAPLRVALLGCGTVGAEVVRMLQSSAEDLTARVGAPLEIVGIAVRRLGRARDVDVDDALFTTDAEGLVARDDVDIVVEVIGGIEPARTLLVAP